MAAAEVAIHIDELSEDDKMAVARARVAVAATRAPDRSPTGARTMHELRRHLLAAAAAGASRDAPSEPAAGPNNEAAPAAGVTIAAVPAAVGAAAIIAAISGSRPDMMTS